MKELLRKTYLKHRENMTLDEVNSKSQAIIDLLIESHHYKRSNRVYIYISHDNEVDTRVFIKQAWHDGKDVYVPKVMSKGYMQFFLIESMDDVCKGQYGILEPISLQADEPTNDDIMIMPGVVYDIHKNRIGYGGGYYDRYLNGLNQEPLCIALSYEMQVVDDIEVDPHDRQPDYILTEARWIK